MKRITNKQEADSYYQIINKHIDDYIENWNINPKNLKKYFSKKDKVKNFLNRVGLNDVEKVENILRDIIEDREAMVKDKVLKFENYIVSESLDFSELNEEYEKVLADLFHTSLSHIEVSNEKTHRYKVDDIGESNQVSIFSSKDIEEFKNQLKNLLIEEADKSDIDLYQVPIESGRDLKTKLSLSLSDVIDKEKLKEKLENLLDEKKVLNILTLWLNDYALLKSGKKFEFHKKYHDYFIWILINKK